jgi:hypothetical protein
MDYEQLATEHSQLTTYTKQSNNIVIIYIYIYINVCTCNISYQSLFAY